MEQGRRELISEMDDIKIHDFFKDPNAVLTKEELERFEENMALKDDDCGVLPDIKEAVESTIRDMDRLLS